MITLCSRYICISTVKPAVFMCVMIDQPSITYHFGVRSFKREVPLYIKIAILACIAAWRFNSIGYIWIYNINTVRKVTMCIEFIGLWVHKTSVPFFLCRKFHMSLPFATLGLYSRKVNVLVEGVYYWKILYVLGVFQMIYSFTVTCY